MLKSKWLILLALALFIWTGEVFSATEVEETGNLAGEFELENLEGKTHQLADYLEHGSVVLWFTNLCGGCQRALPEIKEVFKDAQTPLLIVSLLGDNQETPEQVRESYELTFPILLDTEGVACKQYSGNYIPNTCPVENLFLIDAERTILFRGHYPGLGKSELEKLFR
ncbi:MAG: redoxin domain-containing protein [bacterium]